jgi:HK97 gp10 family phage protein
MKASGSKKSLPVNLLVIIVLNGSVSADSIRILLVTSIRVEGREELAAVLKRAGSALQPAFSEALLKYAQNIVDGAKADAPVRTGALHDSIRIFSINAKQAEIGSDLPYSGYVEKGTSRMEAQPYLEPSVKLYFPIFVKDVADGIAKTLGAAR